MDDLNISMKVEPDLKTAVSGWKLKDVRKDAST